MIIYYYYMQNPKTPKRLKKKLVKRNTRFLPDIYHFKLQFMYDVNLTAGTINDKINAMRPDAAADFSSLGNLFDLYRVRKVVITSYPSYTNVDVADTGVLLNNVPFYIVYDPDSDTKVTTVSAFAQYDKVKVMDMTKRWKYVVSPGVQYDNSVANAGMTVHHYKGKDWLDIANVTDYNKGIIQFLATGTGLTTQTIMQWKIAYYLELCVRR